MILQLCKNEYYEWILSLPGKSFLLCHKALPIHISKEYVAA